MVDAGWQCGPLYDRGLKRNPHLSPWRSLPKLDRLADCKQVVNLCDVVEEAEMALVRQTEVD